MENTKNWGKLNDYLRGYSYYPRLNFFVVILSLDVPAISISLSDILALELDLRSDMAKTI